NLEKSDTLLDLFCGIGSIGLSMAKDAGELIGIEIVAPAVECAKENARAAGIENAHFFAGDATETEKLLSIAEAELGRKISPDVVILDPPRAGCDEKLIDFVSGLSQRRIVYISCNPTTLARDVKRFFENGYTCDTVYGFDLFPKTGHVESVVCLTRRLDN
ncbi:MAG: class I SAM-dependent RNA methyltransferase, partial [Clostridia bacterium]|nr:class I SAM-dependent RNA methyltransferase [Clostridia bacterium]